MAARPTVWCNLWLCGHASLMLPPPWNPTLAMPFRLIGVSCFAALCVVKHATPHHGSHSPELPREDDHDGASANEAEAPIPREVTRGFPRRSSNNEEESTKQDDPSHDGQNCVNGAPASRNACAHYAVLHSHGTGSTQRRESVAKRASTTPAVICHPPCTLRLLHSLVMPLTTTPLHAIPPIVGLALSLVCHHT